MIGLNLLFNQKKKRRRIKKLLCGALLVLSLFFLLGLLPAGQTVRGNGEAGADIVCAAITSAVRLVETTVNDVLGLAASVKVRESDAAISLRLPGSLGQTAESTCQALLAGMMVYFAQLHDEYPENIEVLEARAHKPS